jgi:predicted Zn-dependent protease
VYRLVAYAPAPSWASYQGTAEQALRSFAPLTDPAALGVQPQHVNIVTLSQQSSIAQMAVGRTSPISSATLALINQVDVQTQFASGRLVKWVVGQSLP